MLDSQDETPKGVAASPVIADVHPIAGNDRLTGESQFQADVLRASQPTLVAAQDEKFAAFMADQKDALNIRKVQENLAAATPLTSETMKANQDELAKLKADPEQWAKIQAEIASARGQVGVTGKSEVATHTTMPVPEAQGKSSPAELIPAMAGAQVDTRPQASVSPKKGLMSTIRSFFGFGK